MRNWGAESNPASHRLLSDGASPAAHSAHLLLPKEMLYPGEEIVVFKGHYSTAGLSYCASGAETSPIFLVNHLIMLRQPTSSLFDIIMAAMCFLGLYGRDV